MGNTEKESEKATEHINGNENPMDAANETEKEQENEISELQKKDQEIQLLNDKYLRLYSEFENFRKRTQKERIELIKTAGADIFTSLLPILDDFERAMLAMQDTKDIEGVKDGVELIYNKLLNTLKQQGLEAMESSVGNSFDSDFHEAITQVPAPSKKLKGKVVDEVEKGYVVKGKVLRYAKVVVGN